MSPFATVSLKSFEMIGNQKKKKKERTDSRVFRLEQLNFFYIEYSKHHS